MDIQPVIWCNMGGHGATQRTRNIAPRHLENGWDELAGDIRAAQAQGYRRAFIQNPWGHLNGEDMQFDQKLHMAESNNDGRFDKLLAPASFGRAIRPLVNEGMEIIGKVGALRKDKDFSALEPGEPNDMLFRAWLSIEDILTTGCSLGWDAAAWEDQRSDTCGLLTALRAWGVRNYIEPWPEKAYLTVYPGFAMERYFDPDNPGRPTIDSGIYAPAERMVILSQKDYDPGSMSDRANELIGMGITPVIASMWLKFDGEKMVVAGGVA